MKAYAADRISPIYARSNAATQSRQVIRRVVLDDLPLQLATLLMREVRSMAPIKVPQIVSYNLIQLEDKHAPQKVLRLGHEYANARSLSDIIRMAATHKKAPPDLFMRRICRGVINALVILETINGRQYVHGHLSLENIIASSTGDSVQLADYAFGTVHSAARQLRFRREFTPGYDMYGDGPSTSCHDANQLGSILAYVMSYVADSEYSEEMKQVTLYLRRLTAVSSFAALQEDVQHIFESKFTVAQYLPPQHARQMGQSLSIKFDRSRRPLSGSAANTGPNLPSGASLQYSHSNATTPARPTQIPTKAFSVDYGATCVRQQAQAASIARKDSAPHHKTENILGDTSLSDLLDLSNISVNEGAASTGGASSASDTKSLHSNALDLSENMHPLRNNGRQDSESKAQDEQGAALQLLEELEELAMNPHALHHKLSINIPLSTRAFELALIYSKTYLVEAIIAYGPLLVGSDGRTGLILSVIYNVAAGIDKYTKTQHGYIDSSGNTALTYAIRLNRRSFVRALAKYELRIRGPQNILPVDLARALNNRDVTNILLLADDMSTIQQSGANVADSSTNVNVGEPYLPPTVVGTLLLSASHADQKEEQNVAPKSKQRPFSCRPELLYRNNGSPLIAAVKEGKPTQEIIRLIPEHAGKREKNGATALSTALDMGMLKIAMLIAPYELLIRGKEGVFPIEAVMQKGMQQLALDLVDAVKETIGELHWAKLKECISRGDLVRIERLCSMPTSARATIEKDKAQALRNSQYMSPSIASQQILNRPSSASLFSRSSISTTNNSANLIVSGSFVVKDPDAVRRLSKANMARTEMLKDSELGLINAVRRKYMMGVRSNLKQVCHRDSKGWTALMYAAFLGFNPAIPLLNAEYGLTVPETGVTALMLAAEVGNLDAVGHLAPYEGKILSKSGKTALIMAIESDHYKCAEVLAFEANVWSPGCDSPLLFAIKCNRIPFAWLCIPRGCGARDSSGATALMHTIAVGNTQLAKVLVLHESGMKDNRGMTALMYCVQYSCYEIALLLVDKEIGMKNNIGHTALSLAIELQNQRFITMLERRMIRPGHTLV